MMRTLPLRQEPSVRQIEALLAMIDRELSKVGAKVTRGKGGLTFRMPLPWRAPHLGFMLAITSGKTVVSAGHGGPWRVRYDLNFLTLRLLTTLITVLLVALHWQSKRVLLLNELIALWGLGYGVLYVAATKRFQKMIEKGAREVVERRSRQRVSGVSSTPSGSFPALDEGGGRREGGDKSSSSPGGQSPTAP